eukprot:TRINITY_DN384_c0_g1_i14.p3 TRINITY_DN384_c0_g1~~TRINITY_DN384_c0_g1_i14.p3  ORF type:complete len:292 (-),score=24.52 TRINITY_DN384_c0_g1_i14:1790-2665(-)
MNSYCFFFVMMLFTMNAAKWNYDLGGRDWEGNCKSGKFQSPINIPFRNHSLLTPIEGDHLRARFMFGSSDNVVVYNNGRSITLSFDRVESQIRIPIVNGLLHGIVGDGNKNVSNTQQVPAYMFNFHIHQPGEHSFDGMLAPLEGHVVMKIMRKFLPSCPHDFCLTVVGFRFQYTEENEENYFLSHLLKSIGGQWPSIIGEGQHADSVIDFGDLLATPTPSYVVYNGSLTTPPCTEYILWHVVEEPLPISVQQVEALQAIISKVSRGVGRNSRGIQPLNDRVIGYVGVPVQL